MKNDKEVSLAGGDMIQRKKLDKEMKELQKSLRDYGKEKDDLHRQGMLVDGEQRTLFFQKAVTFTNKISMVRRQINLLSKRLKRL
jgi:hypothetical protein